ncbi:hypothetical protein LIER_22149 [Lithospermum erythrorhizon]|uniref:Uncharacterized protein n=1 Tax=Lithospermum erythrorhizon TaxID=34254 RepID=A0AAV3QU23_LITER
MMVCEVIDLFVGVFPEAAVRWEIGSEVYAPVVGVHVSVVHGEPGVEFYDPKVFPAVVVPVAGFQRGPGGKVYVPSVVVPLAVIHREPGREMYDPAVVVPLAVIQQEYGREMYDPVHEVAIRWESDVEIHVAAVV